MSGTVHLSCPWCPWAEDVDLAVTLAEATEFGRARVEQHNAEVGHAIKKGRKPRVTIIKRRPVL